MKLDPAGACHLTYCTNIHAGETWQEVRQNLGTYLPAAKAALAPDAAFGVGLRLSAAAAESLADDEVRREFKTFLAAEELYVFTLNGFPYGEFHGTPVKTNVYRPDWRDPHRLAYTNRLADILAALLPAGVRGSISTVPVSYGTWIQSPDDLAAARDNLLACARHLADLEQRTGRTIRLALEPEPDCAIEDTPGAIRFFNDVLSPADRYGLLDYLGICFDTCHLAVQFEDLQTSLPQLTAAGIAIPKVQISAALRAPVAAHARDRLARFADPVYLHQVKTRTAAGPGSYADLPAFLDADTPESTEARVHCHVPLYFEGDDDLQSTNTDLSAAFFRAAIAAGIDQFEIETYTFDVLPPELQAKGVVNSITEEYRWVLERMEGTQT